MGNDKTAEPDDELRLARLAADGDQQAFVPCDRW
jgi:hypothetical protein